MIRKLRIKFICVNMIIVLIMLSLILGAIVAFTQYAMEQAMISFLEQIVNEPAGNAEPEQSRDGVRLVYFTIIVKNGTAEVLNNTGNFLLDDSDLLQTIADEALSGAQPTGVLDSCNLRYYCRPEGPDGTKIVFADASVGNNMLRSLWGHCLAVGGVSLLFFFLVSLGLSWWAIHPVDVAWKQQKQFVSDASHELKTPLTLISLNTELLQMQAGTGPMADTTAHIMNGVARMKALVESLLALARTDNGIPHKTMSRVDLSQLVSLCTLSFDAAFLENGQEVSTQIEPGLYVYGSNPHLEQVLSVLLDNAHKYGEPNGQVGITLMRSGSKNCLLCVSSSGNPIPKERLSQIFDRFYRLDEARVANGSYGLGLSIAKAIVTEHRGKIWAESNGAGNRFLVSLPQYRYKRFKKKSQK